MEKFIQNNLERLDYNEKIIKKIIEKAKTAKKQINHIFDIDEEIGFKKFEIEINKKTILNNFLKENYRELEAELYDIIKKDKKINSFYIEEIEAIEKDKFGVKLSIAQNRNKHLWTTKSIEVKYSELRDIIVEKLLHDYYYVSEISPELSHKVISECKSKIDVYIVTNSLAMLFASESKHFESCHRIFSSNEYAGGNMQNLLSDKVFAIFRMKGDELLSRTWVYCDFYENHKMQYIISRIYNNGRMTGAHIIELFQKISEEKNLNLKVKNFGKIDKLIVENYYGYNDLANGREGILINNFDENEKIYIDYPELIDIKTGKEGFYKTNNYKFSETYCHSCDQAIYEDDDDYIITSEGYWFHTDCSGYWYCDYCEDYHMNQEACYEVFGNHIYYYCKMGLDDIFYCYNCEKYYKTTKEYYEVYYDRNNYYIYCKNCIEDKDVLLCSHCGKYYIKDCIDTKENYVCELCI